MTNSETARIVSETRIRARADKRQELFLTISSLLESIRHEEGCRAYKFYGEAGDENSFILIGDWESIDDCERHLRSKNFTILTGSLGLLTSGEPLDLRVLSEVALN
jgi:quinol monooxygenase YgiN